MVDNFIFDDISLRDKGFIVVDFNGGGDGEIETDSQFTYNHISMYNGKFQPFITSVYEDPLVMEWYIMADPCVNGDAEYNITVRQMADLKRWLVRPTPHELRIPTTEYRGIHWIGTFKLQEYIFGDKRIGAHLTFECNAPFGYYTKVLLEGTLAANEVLTFEDTSDEIGYIYPYIHVIPQIDGDLEITDRKGRVTRVTDCTQGELIHFTKYLTVNLSVPAHNRRVGECFNYVFYRISNMMIDGVDDRINTFSCNLPVEYQIVYKPIAKVVVV